MTRKLARALASIGVIASMALAGCGSDSGDSSGSSSGEPVVIRYISSTILESPEADYEKKKIEEFNSSHPQIKVEVEGVAANDLMEKYTALGTANDLPDFYMADMKNAMDLIDMGIAAPLNDVMGKEYLSTFDDKSLAAYTVDGDVYGVPWFTTAQGVVYRADLFEADGVQPPQTWDELVTAAKKLTHGNQYGMAIVGSNNASGAGRFQNVIRHFGVNEFQKDSAGKWTTDIGSDKYIEALTAYTDLATVDGATPPGVTDTDYAAAVNLIASGQATMLITGSNAIGAITSKAPQLKGKLASFPIPRVERSVFSQNGFGFFVSPNTEHADAVAEFLKFFINKDTSIEFAQMTGRLPVVKAAIDSSALDEDPALTGFLTAFRHYDEDYQIPMIPGFSEVNSIHADAYQAVFNGTATPQEAARQAGERAQKIVDEANANQ